MDIHLKLRHCINDISSSDLKLGIPKQVQEEPTILENSDNSLLKLNQSVSQDIQDMKLINMINEVNENQIEFTVIDPSETNYENVSDLFEKLDDSNDQVKKSYLDERIKLDNHPNALIKTLLNYMEGCNGKSDLSYIW